MSLISRMHAGGEAGQPGPQYLEDLACAYWLSETLFAAVETDLFTLLAAGSRTAGDIAATLAFDPGGVERWLQVLWALGLLERIAPSSRGGVAAFANSELSATYLVQGRDGYQGDSILWRKYLAVGWQSLLGCLQAGGRVLYPAAEEPHEQLARRVRRYIRAMDNVAGVKAREIVPVFKGVLDTGAILDVGAGSGAMAAGFLEQYPGLRATLIDLPEVLDFAGELLQSRSCIDRITCSAANILEPWPVSDHSFDLVILSNVLHAYSEQEVPPLLAKSAACLKPGGLLLVHDFWPEHSPVKAALFDLNMLINTYNGRLFPASWVRSQLAGLDLCSTELIPLRTDTALMIAGKNEQALASLCLNG
ncbi:MAG: class I SAM-dependent methyltransferase [Thermacetogeniaceae bacterium]